MEMKKNEGWKTKEMLWSETKKRTTKIMDDDELKMMQDKKSDNDNVYISLQAEQCRVSISS